MRILSVHQGYSYENGCSSTVQYGPYSSCVVQRVRGTKGFVLEGYDFESGTAINSSTEHEEYGVRRVSYIESTKLSTE